MNNINELENEICESCADHVCNENCGCELSDIALKNINEFKLKENRKNKEEYLEFVNLFGGFDNIKKISKKGNSIYFELVNVIDTVDWNKVELFNNYSVEVLNNVIKLTYTNIQEIRDKIFDTTTLVLNDLKEK